jgi:hypothetical protein
MYKLSVCALFKNESHCIKEWIDHYIFHGFDHIYLLNDESDDDYNIIIKGYIERGIITLIHVKWDRYYGRQRDIYAHYMLPLLCETEWLLMCDLDEFMWSSKTVDLKNILRDCDHLAEIQVVQTLYGSNGHVSQPTLLVPNFTKRRSCQYGTARTCGYKYFVNSRYPFKELNVHYAVPENPYDQKNRWLVLNDEYFTLNHYCGQSMDYFRKKCVRSDVNEFKTLTMDDFPEFDINEVEDFGLCEQNKSINIL